MQAATKWTLRLYLCRFKLVGHDFGAALAWSLAISLPERVERLVVVSVGHLGKLSGSDAATFVEQGIMLLVAHAGGADPNILTLNFARQPL